MEPTQAKKYRSLVATVNYLALDWPDLQFAAGVLGRTASRPTTRSWKNLKKVSRYLVSHLRIAFEYGWCSTRDLDRLAVFSDSDWAGCRDS